MLRQEKFYEKQLLREKTFTTEQFYDKKLLRPKILRQETFKTKTAKLRFCWI